jgi:hypothetical protein
MVRGHSCFGWLGVLYRPVFVPDFTQWARTPQDTALPKKAVSKVNIICMLLPLEATTTVLPPFGCICLPKWAPTAHQTKPDNIFKNNILK